MQNYSKPSSALKAFSGESDQEDQRPSTGGAFQSQDQASQILGAQSRLCQSS